MADHLCISIRFLDGAFHGRSDYGEPEWPPSPLRLFQAIVAASAARWNERRGLRHGEAALKWLEQLAPPSIAAPQARLAQGYRAYVPNNVGDLVGRSLSKGGNDSLANYRTEKPIQPNRFDQEQEVHYLWNLANQTPEYDRYRQIISEAVHAITHVGWGVDLVVATVAEIDHAATGNLQGHKWTPVEGGAIGLRCPRAGTMDDLSQRHQAFLNRVHKDGFAPVPPLSVFDIISYRRDTDPPGTPYAIFALRKTDDSGFCSFQPSRKSLHLSGMLRHAASDPALLRSLGWNEDYARQIVLGHGEKQGEAHQAVNGARLAFLPLPSIEWRPDKNGHVAGSIRRVLVTLHGFASGEAFQRFIQRFGNQDLIEEETREPVAALRRQRTHDGATRLYLEKASSWATVTPVILPGYDDPRKLRQRLRNEKENLSASEKSEVLRRLDQRIDSLLRKALRHAGFSDLLVKHAELEWRNTGFWPGTDLATSYAAGDQHRRFRRLHVRITWRDQNGTPLELPGPLCIGSGKFTGMGLFAALPREAAQKDPATQSNTDRENSPE